MNKYQRNNQTGQITLSDGTEREGFTQIKFLRCNWVKVENKKKPQYAKLKMKLPYALYGINAGGHLKFRLPYQTIKGE